MFIVAQIIFWGSTLAMLHSYVIYPLLMRILARGERPNATTFSPDDTDLPVVSVLMSVYNEERVIGEKIYSLTKLNYPPEKLRIYIGSDGSSDRTNDLVAHAFDIHFPLPHAHFSLFRERRGKPPVINDLAALAQADYRKLYQPETLRPSNPPPLHIFLRTHASVILEPDTL